MLDSLRPVSFRVRPARSLADFWSVARLHRRCFYPGASGPLALFLEWDRAMGLQLSTSFPPNSPASSPAGLRSVCLLAETASQDVVATTALECGEDRFPRRTLAAFLSALPPRGAKLAYLSSLSVAPELRRKGVARQLLAEAESTAGRWGCRSVALHVDCDDVGAQALYQRAGYRSVSVEPPWAPALNLRRVRLRLMIRRLERSISVL